LRYTTIALAAILTIYFFWFAHAGLAAGFSYDDLMNIYRAQELSYAAHLRDILLFFTYSQVFRPLGSLVYKVVFDLAGMSALPFRIVCYSVLLVNLWLAYWIAKRLTGSRECGGMAALLFAFHGRNEMLFVNTGYLYDLLCFTFYAGAILYYASSAKPRWWVLCGLQVLALNSKEIGVTLPATLGLMALFCLRPEPWTDRKSWLLRNTRLLLPMAAVSLAFVMGRVDSPQGLMHVDAYTPDLRLAVFLDRAHGFVQQLAYGTRKMTPELAAWFAGAVLAATLVLRDRRAWFALLWMPVALLPIAFITQRPLAAAVVSYYALCMLLSVLLWRGSRFFRAPRGVAFLAVLVVITLVHRKHHREWTAISAEHRQIAELQGQLDAWRPEFKSGEPVLFLNDPFPDHEWNAVFLGGLVARNGWPRPAMSHLVIHNRRALLNHFPPQEHVGYKLVLSYENGHFVRCASESYRAVQVSDLAGRTCLPAAQRNQVLARMPAYAATAAIQ
jgi:hypothetical protein